MDLRHSQNKKILVIGDVMLDRYWSGQTQRISPEAPVPIVQVNAEEDRLGGAGNVALNLAVLTAKVTLLGVIGHDAHGQRIQALCESAKIHFVCLHSEQATITKLRIISKHQQLLRIDFEEKLAETEAMQQNILHLAETLINSHDVVILSDYGKGTLKNCSRLIQLAQAAGKPILVDPKGKNFDPYKGATVLTPNQAEFEAVVGDCESETQFESRAQHLCEVLSLDHLLITRGEKGMSLFRPQTLPYHLAAEARAVFDVTGAGDTVIALMALMLALEADAPTAMQYANRAAGMVVTKWGAAQVTLNELMHHDQTKKYQGFALQMTLQDILPLVYDLKQQGQRVVFTNGCFDLLHKGHVDYLNAARETGDFLIVGLNSDASVQRLKGIHRPIMSEESRVAVLASLACVDAVIVFDEETPLQLIQAICPDVLVKGADYALTDIVGHDVVLAAGGAVKRIELTAGYSTTKSVEKICQSKQ